MSVSLSKLGQRQEPSNITRLMAVALERPDMLSLAAGFTDTDSLPLADVGKIVAEITESGVEGKQTLQYGTNSGRPDLRSLLARRIESNDTLLEGSLNEERLFISNGSQQALYLAIQTLCDPGDFVLVEQPTYFVFLEILSGLGVNPVPMPMTESGEVDISALESLLGDLKRKGQIERLKAVYLVSYFANPSGHSISDVTKQALGELLSRLSQKVAVIEDAAYRELFYEQPHEARSCLAIRNFNGLPVLYSSTLTKSFASGLKVGYAYCTDQRWLDAMLSVKGQQDFGTTNFNQAIVEKALDCGIYDSQLARLRKIYREKMVVLHEALLGRLGELGWKWSVPSGGLYLWLCSPDGLRTDRDSAFHTACLEEGVFYVPGEMCFPRQNVQDKIRLSFGSLRSNEIEMAVERLQSAAKFMIARH